VKEIGWCGVSKAVGNVWYTESAKDLLRARDLKSDVKCGPGLSNDVQPAIEECKTDGFRGHKLETFGMKNSEKGLQTVNDGENHSH